MLTGVLTFNPSPIPPPPTDEHATHVESQKTEPVPDSRQISAPEVCRAVATEPKTTQTAPLSPANPFPSNSETVQHKKSKC